MEGERVDTKLMSAEKREAFVYSLDVIRVALQNGWSIKIFQRDPNLKYLKSILLDIEINPDSFFDFNQFVEEKRPKCAYEWAREVQKEAICKYDLNGRSQHLSSEALELLDKAYYEDVEPWKVLSNEQLVNLNVGCKELTDYIYSLE